MKRYLSTIPALFALLALLVASAPAGAAGGYGGGGGRAVGIQSRVAASAASTTVVSTVTQKFKLTLYGTAAKGDAMVVNYSVKQPNGSVSPSQVYVFCGKYRSSPRVYTAKPACKGGGTVYNTSVSLPKGSTITFSFIRQKASDAVNGGASFYRGSHRLDYNWQDSAWYRYGR
ncbi:MAG: hypothetical protein M3Q29_04700 [Chloroflexota bacterium]|nr:hypothetical protein [Chloroflexota bacterium]